jgi:hypothetical protein
MRRLEGPQRSTPDSCEEALVDQRCCALQQVGHFKTDLPAMTRRTESELVFEAFCKLHALPLERIKEGTSSTPDYSVVLGATSIHVEIKQIDTDPAFSTLQLRTPGTHVRAKINQARDQVRQAANNDIPAILLIYNNLDRMQLFGTEQHDFLAAMYGELTLVPSPGTSMLRGPFHGRNQSLREDKNVSFSAVGHLCGSTMQASVHLYENAYAKIPRRPQI